MISSAAVDRYTISPISSSKAICRRDIYATYMKCITHRRAMAQQKPRRNSRGVHFFAHADAVMAMTKH